MLYMQLLKQGTRAQQDILANKTNSYGLTSQNNNKNNWREREGELKMKQEMKLEQITRQKRSHLCSRETRGKQNFLVTRFCRTYIHLWPNMEKQRNSGKKLHVWNRKRLGSSLTHSKMENYHSCYYFYLKIIQLSYPSHFANYSVMIKKAQNEVKKRKWDLFLPLKKTGFPGTMDKTNCILKYEDSKCTQNGDRSHMQGKRWGSYTRKIKHIILSCEYSMVTIFRREH